VSRHVVRLVVDYFAYVVCPAASARRRLLRPRRASGCLGTSRGSSSTSLPTPRIRVPRHVAWLVIDHASSRRSTSRRSVALALDVRSIAPSRGSTTPCRHSTCCPVALALLQPRRTSRLLVSRQHRLYFEYATRRRDIVFRSHRVDHSSRLVFQTSRERQSHPQQLVGINSE
jgi:hypothetical protein